MKTISALFLSALICFAGIQQPQPLMDSSGDMLEGLVRATVLVYDSETGIDFIWAGTTDGSLPPLKVVSGYVHNMEKVLPGYIRDTGDLWIEIRIDGHPVTSDRIHYTGEGLRRESPPTPGEVSETLEDELQIGLPGHELYVASATTGFGVDVPVERVDIDGAVGLREMTTPPTATTDFGKVYVDDADGHLYFMDEGGAATDLLETSSTVVGGGLLAALGTEQIHTCVDKTIYIGAHIDASSSPYTHLWTGDTGPLSATNIPNPSFTATAPGVYNLIYTITDSEGASSQYLFAITAHALPTPSIEAYPASGGCEGQPVSLIGDGCYEKYCWDPGPCTKLFEVTRTETYELTVVDEWGCRGTADYTVSFLDPPVANAGSDQAECYGGSDLSLGGSPAATGGTPPYFYSWTGSGTPYLSSTNVANPTIDVGSAAPGVYSVSLEVTDANGCSDTDGPVVVTVYALPVASVSATTPVCPGDAISLSGGATGGLGPYSYSWSGPSGFTSFIQNPEIASAVEGNQGTYSLTVTDAHGCVSIPATVAVVVDDPATVVSNPSDVTICQGLDAAFSVTAGGTGPFTYQWERNTGSSWADLSGATSASYTASAVAPSMDGYQYRCEIMGVCSPSVTSAAATLTVNLAPAITSHPTDQSVSAGDPATFTVTATGTGTLTYQWQQSTDSGSSWTDVGSSSPSYTTGSTTGGMNGYQYRVIVTGTCSPQATSTVATLTVLTDLYSFTSHTFNPCGATGRTGPTLSTCRSTYTTSWDDTYLNMSTQGIQEWTVPANGTYRITCVGAGGGRGTYGSAIGGSGASMRGDFVLSMGDVLYIIAGQLGETTGGLCGGGGGASWVYTSTSPMIIAGAGGGAGRCGGDNGDAGSSATGSGAAGSYCTSEYGSEEHGGGGAGWLGNGAAAGTGSPEPARSPANGATGGLPYDEYSPGNGQGGFGGGAGGGGNCGGGGGGGGYSGGNGGCNNGSGSTGGGDGGLSYNAGTTQSNSSGVNSGNGYVTIQKL